MARNKPNTLVPVNIPKTDKKPKLPNNGIELGEKHLVFTFTCFDRMHELFNIAGDGKWFLDFLDCLKSVSGQTIQQLQHSMHDLHRIDWCSANAKCPDEQHEYWQFRINKSKGRVVGFIINSIFYVVWLDRHHNLTDSPGYQPARNYSKPTPKSEYELREEHIVELQNELEEHRTILETEHCKNCQNKLI